MRFVLGRGDFSYLLFYPKPNLKKTKCGFILLQALRYIEWGETQVTRERQKTASGIPWPETESVKRRKPGWWSIPGQNLIPTKNFLLYVINERFLSPYSENELISDRCFHRIFPLAGIESELLAAVLNSTLTIFMISLMGRSNLGQGALKFEATDTKRIQVINPLKLEKITQNELIKRFRKFSKRKSLSIFEEVKQQDRLEMDEVLFDYLNLTRNEQQAVYEAVIDLVQSRIQKASSFKTTQTSRDLSEMEW